MENERFMPRIILQPSGKSVECASGDTVLMALEKAGYALPNNCRAGACGECKVKVLSGQYDQGMVLDMALSQDERRHEEDIKHLFPSEYGWIIKCSEQHKNFIFNKCINYGNIKTENRADLCR